MSILIQDINVLEVASQLIIIETESNYTSVRNLDRYIVQGLVFGVYFRFEKHGAYAAFGSSVLLEDILQFHDGVAGVHNVFDNYHSAAFYV